MDFKFSCKWFEVSFSGDPGYVERQIEKYEPYILQALKQMEAEQQHQEEEEEAQKSELEAKSKPAAAEENGPREKPYYGKRRKNHSGRGRAPDKSDKKERPATHTYRKDYNNDQSSRSDYLRHQNESENSGQEDKEEDDSIPFPESAEEKSHHQQESSATDADKPEDKPGPEEKPVGPETNGPAHDFPSRRKTPRIKAEDLVRTIDDKRPRTHHDRVMVFGHYMETEGGGSDFTIPEIKRCYRAANQDPGNNIEQVINHATRSGFIVRHAQARTNRFKLSTKGRRYVEDGLKLT